MDSQILFYGALAHGSQGFNLARNRIFSLSVIPENFGAIAEKFVRNPVSLNKQYLSYSFIK